MDMAVDGEKFMTKTQHYRKVTKPLLERKRRARMNLYLDELKDLIVSTMDLQGEQVNKLEKADLLEMTVTYLKSRKHQGIARISNDPHPINIERFRAGYTQAAYEVSKLFATFPGMDLKFGTRLMKQLAVQLKDIPSKSQRSSNDGGNEYQQNSNICHFIPDWKDIHNENRGLANIQEQNSDVWRPW